MWPLRTSNAGEGVVITGFLNGNHFIDYADEINSEHDTIRVAVSDPYDDMAGVKASALDVKYYSVLPCEQLLLIWKQYSHYIILAHNKPI